jgi:adenylate cyclase
VPRRRRLIILFTPVPVILLLCLVEALGLTRYLGNGFYDLFLRLERPPRIARELLLVDIDDRAIATVGSWPWSRDLLADGLLAMKELDARYAVFDTPFAGRAPLGVDRRMLREELPENLETEYGRIQENVRTLFDAIRRGSLRPGESPRYVAEILRLIESSKARLLDSVALVERDNDLYLGQTLRLFERAFIAVELDTSRGATLPSIEDLGPVAHFALGNVKPTGLPQMPAGGLLLPAPHASQGARGGGFREIEPDYDGVIRRVRPLASIHGQVAGQVAFAALLDRLGGPAVTVAAEHITLTGGDQPKPAATVAIPLTPGGEVLIDWPHPRSGSAPRRLSWNDLYRLTQLEEDLAVMLREMDGAGYLTFHRAQPSVPERYRMAERLRSLILAEGRTELTGDWRKAREEYFAHFGVLLAGDVEQKIVSSTELFLASATGTEEERAAAAGTRDRVPVLFQDARRTLAELLALRGTLGEAMAGSFCVVSVTGESATVAGSTPLGGPATSGQASAALVNAVLTRQFLRSLRGWYSVAAAAVIGFLMAVALIRVPPRASLLAGLAVAALCCAVGAVLLIYHRLFADPTAPVLCSILVSAAIAAVKARQEHADREGW